MASGRCRGRCCRNPTDCQEIVFSGAGGSSPAGAVLKLRDAGLGMPAAVVLWSPWADITETGDTCVTLKAAEPNYLYEKSLL
jgi:monoterpene epsilon-lactone hydrolase